MSKLLKAILDNKNKVKSEEHQPPLVSFFDQVDECTLEDDLLEWTEEARERIEQNIDWASMPIYSDPECTQEIIERPTYQQEFDRLTAEGYKDLGWSNGGVGQHTDEAKDKEFTHIISNRSGSSCLYANHQHKLMYSVDMGD